MNLVRAMREAIRGLRSMARDWPPTKAWVDDLREDHEGALEEPEGAVDLAICVGSECIQLHGLRAATWKGTGPWSILRVCDECHSERLTAEERGHMAELFGAPWIRHMGLHAMHNGREAHRPCPRAPAEVRIVGGAS